MTSRCLHNDGPLRKELPQIISPLICHSIVWSLLSEEILTQPSTAAYFWNLQTILKKKKKKEEEPKKETVILFTDMRMVSYFC